MVLSNRAIEATPQTNYLKNAITKKARNRQPDNSADFAKRDRIHIRNPEAMTRSVMPTPVSYTHLTLPTIYSV